ncbi:jerky protein homolog-like [Ptychodera flava]|uniref:jerky protein homolog-like n=1 Tax=Ptychodera flava TaxID=63121 RepID=UPI00396A6FD7
MGCANASGTHKLPPVIIGKSRNPRCFKHVNMDNLSVRYYHEANAWISAELFSTWFRDDFVPSVRHHLRQKQLPEKALLLIDNAPSHPSTDVLQSNDGLITCMFLPPNTTPLLQPMDQGVLNALKRRYKGKMLRKIVKENSNNISLTECVKTVTLKDTCYMIAESWRELTVDTLANAWHKLRINIADTPETASTPEVTNPASDETIEEVINALPADDRVQASEWFDVDESDPGCQTLADEEIIQAAQKSTTDIDASEDEDDDKENTEPSVPIPTNAEAADMFSRCLLWLEAQPNCEPTQLLLLRSMHQTAVRKRQETAKQKSITSFFKKM